MSKQEIKKIIELKMVNFGYEPKKPILFDINLAINKKQHICVVGANGCGKSTLTKIIAGLFKPQSGSILVDGVEINKKNVKNLKNKVGIVFENPDSQFVGITVEDDIAFGLENKCVKHEDMQSIINNVAKITGITNLLKLDPTHLSGGQKQLVAISSILALEPEVIVLDEATNMLDNSSKQTINNLINTLITKYDKTIVSVTHDMNFAANADVLIVMNDGKIVAQGKPKDIFTQDLSNYKLDVPFGFKLAKQLNLKPTTNLDQLVKEVCHEK